jgi:hemoglobin
MSSLLRTTTISVLVCLMYTLSTGKSLAADQAVASLYERLGGTPVVTAVSGELIDRTAAEPELKRSFDKVDLVRLKKMLTEQICALSGGPCQYSGDSMKEVHAGLNIRQDEFYGMVEVLREIMLRHNIGLRERNELLALLAPMKRDVVTRKPQRYR